MTTISRRSEWMASIRSPWLVCLCESCEICGRCSLAYVGERSTRQKTLRADRIVRACFVPLLDPTSLRTTTGCRIMLNRRAPLTLALVASAAMGVASSPSLTTTTTLSSAPSSPATPTPASPAQSRSSPSLASNTAVSRPSETLAPTQAPSAGFERRWNNICDGCSPSTAARSFHGASKSLTSKKGKYSNAKKTILTKNKKRVFTTEGCKTTTTQKVKQTMVRLGFISSANRHSAESAAVCLVDTQRRLCQRWLRKRQSYCAPYRPAPVVCGLSADPPRKSVAQRSSLKSLLWQYALCSFKASSRSLFLRLTVWASLVPPSSVFRFPLILRYE